MISNRQVKTYRLLKQKKYRKKAQQFLIEGTNLCEAVLKSEYDIEIILVSESIKGGEIYPRIVGQAQRNHVPVEVVPGSVIRTLSDSVSPQGMVAVVKIPEMMDSKENILNSAEILVLDRVRDPGNLGTILRTAEWFGIDTVICSDRCVDLYNSKVLRASAGAMFYLPHVVQGVELIPFLHALAERGSRILLADVAGRKSYRDVAFSRPFALVMGGERQGIRREIHALPVVEIAIPGRGRGDSLNVAIATALLLAEAFEQNN